MDRMRSKMDEMENGLEDGSINDKKMKDLNR
jgi:hypothetical protein